MTMEKILKDIEERKMKVGAFIYEDENGDLKLIHYDSNGLVSFISHPAKSMDVYENLNGNEIRKIAGITKGS